LFNPFGPIHRLDYPRTKGLGFPLGYCLVTFEQEKDARIAMQELNGKPGIGGRPLDITWSKKVSREGVAPVRIGYQY